MANAGDWKNLEKKDSRETAWWQPAITTFLKLSVWIAAPIIIALYLGKWLDSKYRSEPWLFLICIAAAFVVSLFGLIKSTVREYKKFEKESKHEDKI